MPSISIVGAGRLGGALALALHRKGYRVEQLATRSVARAEALADAVGAQALALADNVSFRSDVILIACPDPVISDVAQQLGGKIEPGAVVVHTSGALDSGVLAPLRRNDVQVGSMHPLASVSDPWSGADRFAGTYFCVEGDPRAVEASTEMARSLGAHPFGIDPSSKPLYHAAAVMAAGHTVALFDAACEVLAKCGVDRELAGHVLLPLLRTSVENLGGSLPANALTGTYARADRKTAGMHLKFMEERIAAETREIYLGLALRSVRLATEAGADPAELAKIRQMILMAKENLG